MAGGRQTPRQKLIGMMYLVLTALLALNVSVEVLDAFVLVDEGLQQTNVNFGRKVDMVYSDFNKQRALSAERVEPFYTNAKEIQSFSDSLVSFISNSRTDMISKVDKIPFEQADTMRLIDMKAKDNYSRSSTFWLLEPIDGGATTSVVSGGPGTRGYKLREMIESFKVEIIDRLPEQFRDMVQLGLDTEGPFYDKSGNEITCQAAMFDRQPPVAAATNLSRVITEVRNAEFDAVSILYAAITADDFTFDVIEARVLPKSQIVLQGDRYEADVIVAAFDSKQQPEVIMGGRTIEGGRLSIPATSEGLQRYSGTVRVLGPGGVYQEYPFEGDYIVQRPTATISADAMNVFYMGVDNPVSVSVPGVPSGSIEARISGAGNQLVPRAGGGYNVRLSPNHNVNQNVTISLFARIEGSLRSMGESAFRVRVVPDPYAEIAGQQEGVIPRDVLAGQPIIPRMRDFDFQMDFRITSFLMNTTVSGEYYEWRTSGNQQTAEMEAAIRRSNRGQRFTFENIQAIGDDGRTRNLPPMVFRIQ